MRLAPYEVMNRATRRPGSKAELARELKRPLNSVNRKCRAPERIDNPHGSGRRNEIDNLETLLRGLVQIGLSDEAELIVNHLHCFVQECKGGQSTDSLHCIVEALESIVKGLRIKLSGGRDKDFEELIVRGIGALRNGVAKG